MRVGLQAFSKNFPPGTPVPKPLAQFLEFNNAGGLPPGLLELTDEGPDLVKAWVNEDKEAAARLIGFARTAEGAIFAFWLYGDRTLENAPVVYLDAAAGPETTVLASTVPEFLTLLTVGWDSDCRPVWSPAWTGEEQPVDGRFQRYRDWAKAKLGISVPADPKGIVAKARQAHPDARTCHPRFRAAGK